ncbi:MAG: protein-export chaperone SecB [Pseudomonadota bacterium]
MSETSAEQTEEGVVFDIKKVYTKDISLETPNSPQVFTMEWDPEVNVQLGSETNRLDERFYEVVLSATVTTKLGDRTAYLVEVHQAGIFEITNVEEAELPAVLGSICPGILFPYAREAISDLITRAGFQPMLLSPVNFDALYYQHVVESQAEENGASA